MKKIICAFLWIVLVVSSAKPMSAGEMLLHMDGKDESFSHHDQINVYWADEFSKFEQYYEASDIVGLGKVQSQSVIVENNLIFTISEVELLDVIKGECITLEITQIGGTSGDFKIQAVGESPLLEIGNTYALFLYRGEYCSIAGAGKGAVLVDNGHFDSWIELAKQKLNSAGVNTPKVNSIETPMNGYAFAAGTTSVTFFLDTTKLTNGTIHNAVRTGIYRWNGLSSLGISETNNASASNIEVVFDTNPPVYYPSNMLGNTTWYTKRVITLYYDRMMSFGYYSNTSLWSKLACHEMGHAIGLAHNTTGYSVMIDGINSQASSPQDPDISTLRAMYP